MFNSVAQSVKSIFQRPATKVTDAIVGYYISPNGKVEAIKASSPRLRNYSGGASVVITSDAYGWAKAYAANVWAYRCAKARSKLVGKLKYRVVNKNTRREKPTHPLMIALQRNRTLIRQWEWSRCVWGETFIELCVNEFEYISDLKWLNPLSMDVDTSTGYIREYFYTALNGGKTYRFKPDEIVFDYLDNPFDDLRGMSPLQVVLDELNIDQSQSRVVRSWFDNDARPGIIITPETPMNPTDFERFRDSWKEQFQGPNNANKPAITTHPVKITEIQRAPSSDDAVLREVVMREVCAAFEVPLSFAGAWDAATYQSAPEQRRAMYEDCVIPESDEIKGVINEKIMPYFDEWGGYEFEFVLDDVMVFVEDQKQKEEIQSGRLQSGGITLNEYRKALKLDEFPTGNVLLVPSNFIAVKPEQLGQMTQLPVSPNPFAPMPAPFQPRQVPSSAAPVLRPQPQAALQTITKSEEKEITVPAKVQDSDTDELSAWEKKALNKGAMKAIAFQCYVLPAEVRSFIVRGLTSDELDAKAIKTLFSDARGILDALKLFRATSNEWKDYFVSIVGQANNNRIDRRQLRSLMIAQLGDLGEQAYRDGLRQGGSDRTELTIDDQQALRAWLDDTTSYVDSFVDEVFSSGLSDDQIKARADAWSNKSLSEIFTAGQLASGDSRMYEFVGDDGDDSCPTCTRLKGQVHPLTEWVKRGFRPRVDTQNFECGGFQCNHDIKPTDKSEQGAW